MAAASFRDRGVWNPSQAQEDCFQNLKGKVWLVYYFCQFCKNSWHFSADRHSPASGPCCARDQRAVCAGRGVGFLFLGLFWGGGVNYYIWYQLENWVCSPAALVSASFGGRKMKTFSLLMGKLCPAAFSPPKKAMKLAEYYSSERFSHIVVWIFSLGTSFFLSPGGFPLYSVQDKWELHLCVCTHVARIERRWIFEARGTVVNQHAPLGEIGLIFQQFSFLQWNDGSYH